MWPAGKIVLLYRLKNCIYFKQYIPGTFYITHEFIRNHTPQKSFSDQIIYSVQDILSDSPKSGKLHI